MTKEDAQLVEAIARFAWKWLILIAAFGTMLSVQKIARHMDTPHVEVQSNQKESP